MIEIESILDLEKHLDNVDAIVFDLDDTLYSEKQYIKSGFTAIGLIFPEIPFIKEELWEAYTNGKTAIDYVLNKHGLSSQIENALYVYRHQVPDITLYDGVTEMLDRIRKMYKTGIITDGRPEGQHAKLKVLNPKVDNIIITDELGGIEYRKPCETAFILMQSQLHVPFNNMAYIGDNITKDFIAPKKLGMKCIYFNNPDGIYTNRRQL